MRKGRLVPFLGAGVNLCGRPEGQTFVRGQWLPSGHELAQFLASEFFYPQDGAVDLLRVSQYVTFTIGLAELYDVLHDLFAPEYQPTALHVFLAQLPQTLQDAPAHQLIVTTNYDDTLERAFEAAGEPYDLVYYVANGEEEDVGRFRHIAPDGTTVTIDKPNEYDAISLEDRTVIVKIHGMVDRADRENDSYVITEDHYIEYLTRTELANLLPVKLVAKLKDRRTQFLFLGYSLRDWNLRAILHRLWGAHPIRNKSWSVQFRPDQLESKGWSKREVEIFDMPLATYIAALHEAVVTTVGADSIANAGVAQ